MIDIKAEIGKILKEHDQIITTTVHMPNVESFETMVKLYELFLKYEAEIRSQEREKVRQKCLEYDAENGEYPESAWEGLSVWDHINGYTYGENDHVANWLEERSKLTDQSLTNKGKK